MPIWKGTTDIKLQPTYPRFHRDSKGATLTLVFRGPHDALKTYGPDIGDDIALGAFGYEPSGELVYTNSVDCQPDGAGDEGPGTLTVVYTNVPDASYNLIANQTIIEIDASLAEKPLASHPRYCTGGAKALTDTDRKKIADWKAQPSTAAFNAASANAQEFIAKLRKGQDVYFVGMPTARKTTRGTSPPAVSSVGTVSTSAPVSGAPSGYSWLKTADRAIRQAPGAGWERIEEWQGGKAFDGDIYTGVI